MEVQVTVHRRWIWQTPFPLQEVVVQWVDQVVHVAVAVYENHDPDPPRPPNILDQLVDALHGMLAW